MIFTELCHQMRFEANYAKLHHRVKYQKPCNTEERVDTTGWGLIVNKRNYKKKLSLASAAVSTGK